MKNTETRLPPSESATSLSQRQGLLAQYFPQQQVMAETQVFSYREAGQGSLPLVMLHGIGSNAASWFDVARLLEKETRLVAWDAPGYGLSSQLSCPVPKATDYGEALEQFLASLGINECVLVGHSLGALMAAAYTWQYNPGRVRHLVLISPARGYGSPELRSQGKQVREERGKTATEAGIAAMAAQRSDRLLSPSASQVARDWVRWSMSCLNPGGYLQAVELLCGDDIARYTPSPVPVSVYCGVADSITPPSGCGEIARQYGTELQMIPFAGHASPVENPGHVAEMLRHGLIAVKGKNCE